VRRVVSGIEGQGRHIIHVTAPANQVEAPLTDWLQEA
jgi:hypothetical protein